MGKFYITTPIYYPNAELHIGHVYTTTLADIVARYHRLMGDETYFLTGADENSEKVARSARKAGEDPKVFLDNITKHFEEVFEMTNISYDQFVRTTDPEKHWPGAQAVWRKLEASGDIYKKEYEGLYCVGCEAFKTEKELIDGKCPDHDEEPTQLKEENYFFKLSKYENELRKRIESDELRIVPESRKNEMLSFINQGLRDVSFSRPKEKVTFGVPVPGDDSQMMYVWCDALTSYISALGYGRENDELFEKFWPADYHIMAQEILRFHAIYWPAMLLSAGIELPKNIFVHGMILSGGRKMSKTLGNVIDPFKLIETYGADAVRYYIARKIPPLHDGELTEEGFAEVYNGELVNGLGNLVARVMKLAETHLDEPIDIPEPTPFPGEFTTAIENFEFNKAMEYVWKRISDADQKITDTEPFKLVKTDPEKGKQIIRELAAELYWIGRFLYPFLPETNEKIKQAVKENKKPENLFPRLG